MIPNPFARLWPGRTLPAGTTPLLTLSVPLRVAIVGTGKAARFHARALKAIAGATVACFVNRGGSAGQALPEIPSDVPIYRGVDELLTRGGFDVALVAVSWEATAATCVRLLAAGIPCLIEKPLGTSSDDASRIIDAARGRAAFVAYNLRFQSSVRRACEIASAFGRPSSVHIDAPEQSILAKLSAGARGQDAAAQWLLLNTTHALDLFQVLLGSPIAVVAAAAPRTFEGVRADYSALLQAPLGGSGVFTSHWRSPGSWSMRVFGPDYRVSTDLRTNAIEILAPGIAESAESAVEDREFKPGVVRQDFAFLQAVAGKAAVDPRLATLEQGLAVIRLAEQLQTS